MTDKQIIKHNVNVSECEFLGFPRCSKAYCGCDSSELSDLCDDNPNCYYKNWQRKEQECEELKRQHQGDKGLITSTGKMNYQLLQEYDKLKTALTEIKEIAEDESYIGFWDEQISKILQKISEVVECKP